jgi:hypothetical protein
MPTNGPVGERGLTYSFAWSNAFFVGLDNYAQIHRVNQPWLDRQLGTNTRPHVFVFGHEPAFKAFHTDGLDDYPEDRNAFWRCLTASGAKVYLCGHDHFFNAARIEDGDGSSTNDLFQFIVGTGGSTNWPPQRYNYNGTNGPYAPVNLASITNAYGYLLVEISGAGTNDLGVNLTWKQRSYDTNSGAYIYTATTNTLAYTAANRFADRVGDGITDRWRAQFFGGSAAGTNAVSCAGCDPDGDGVDNWHEYVAGTNPTNAQSWLKVQGVGGVAGTAVSFPSSAGRNYTLYYTTNLASGSWTNIPSQTGIPGSGGVDVLGDPTSAGVQRFYRIGVQLP